MSKINSFKHKHNKRAHIPSKEEAGFESANAAVQNKVKASYPKNPVIHRGQDPELFWLNKYGNDDSDDQLQIDIRSLYRHEHISPELLIKQLYKLRNGVVKSEQLSLIELFGNNLEMDEIEKIGDYYQHSDDWKNRMIQGDSLLVMTSLLEREGMAGKIQTIYMDPPYGIKYGSNWQIKLNNRDVKDGKDDNLTGEPEMIKAYRDTWELGIHSYLSYLRDRLLIARELLTESGSCFVQISDENVHLVRNIMDEVFGSENFISNIVFKTSSGRGSLYLDNIFDHIIWYGKAKEKLKYRPIFTSKGIGDEGSRYNKIELPDGTVKTLTKEQIAGKSIIPDGKIFCVSTLNSQGETIGETSGPFEYKGEIFFPPKGRHWSVKLESLKRIPQNRFYIEGKNLVYKRYISDYPVSELKNIWSDTGSGALAHEKQYVVQTGTQVCRRCILMSTDPGDLVLDPTCGSGTTAYVAEQWGRRWITIDTSRIALNLAKTRLMTATYPYYELHDNNNHDLRHGFIYKKVPHVTLKSLANDEPPEEETLYDQPTIDKKKIRVAGPFTIETLQNYEPVSPEDLDRLLSSDNELENFETRIFEHLKSAGIKNGAKNENAVFKRVERKVSASLHAEGFYDDSEAKERKAYIYIGPKFGTVSKQAVNEAIKECQSAGDASWLIILGFSFESDISNSTQTTSMGGFEVTRVRMHDDLLQEGLLKKDKKAASFVTIGEPDIKIHQKDNVYSIEIQGLDIYDPIEDDVKARSLEDIYYWMLDDDYDGSNFIVKQIFFCGGDKDEFSKWKKGLDNLSKTSIKSKLEHTVKIEIDEDAWDRLYNYVSHPIQKLKENHKIAVRIISQFGEESTKVISL
jgi:adenine-specific DNA-methyltransferase